MADDKRLNPTTYTIKWIPCENLQVIWRESQRPPRPKKVQEIIDNFDDELFGYIHVTLPDGNGIYHICDGQTRKAALEKLYGPKECAPCRIAPEGDPEKAAELFLRINTSRRPPTSVDNFKVSVTAKHNTEVQADRIVRKHGYHVDTGNVKGSISAVGSLKGIVESGGGPKVLDQTLRLIREVWDDDQNAVRKDVLKGFAAFLNMFGSYINEPKFVAAVKKKWTPGKLVIDAATAAELHAKKPADAMVDLLLVVYNKVVPAKDRLNRKTIHE
jgi:hypothetical protein